MRRLVGILSLMLVALTAHGVEPARKELVVEPDWKLSGAKIDQSEKPGEGIAKMVVSGEATVTKEKKEAQDTITITGKADVIEYHVALKKFVLRGSPSVTHMNAKGQGTSVQGIKPESTIEIRAHDGTLRIEGPSRSKMIDPDTPGKAKPKRK